MEGEVPEVERAIRALYGPQPLTARGVLHVTSTVERDGRLHVIRVGDDAPKSATDLFVLNLARARADAILTSGAVLRAEPGLQHGLQGLWAEALARYRRALGKSRPPLCAILTRGQGLPSEHPVWNDGTRKLVLTTPEASSALRATLAASVQVVGLAPLDAEIACRFLQARGAGLVSVEAGPSAVAVLYRAAHTIDELWLSRCEGAADAQVVGGSLPENEALFAERSLLADVVREEESGRWRFQRWVRTR